MKIAQISPYFPPHVGGVEYHVKELAEGLAERGHEVTVVSSEGRWSGELVTVPSLNLCYSPIPIKLPELHADIYHSHIPSYLFAFSLRHRKPQVVTYHNDVLLPDSYRGYALPRWFSSSVEKTSEKLVRSILDEAEMIVATTMSYARTSPVLQDYLDKIRVVPNAVNPSLYPRRREKESYVLYAGRMVGYKGADVLIRAMKEVQKTADLELMMVGEGEDRRRLEDLATRLNVKARFTGRLERSMFIDTISRAEMLVNPAQCRLEAFGIVLLEAMACETPVLAYDTPGVNEVAGKGGYVYSNWEELSELIIRLHNSPTRRAELGRKGRRAVEENYSWRRAVDLIEAVYKEVA
ncbi:MAG: glycosyltransferase family 4 protein [Methanothrix sp.]